MNADQHAIRQLVALWHRASAAGDVDAILPLMTDDVVFLAPGQAPFGRDAFERELRSMLRTHRIESAAVIREVQVSGDMAYCWAQLEVRVHPLAGGAAMLRSGEALSILCRRPGGAWRIMRDANMLSASGEDA